MKKLLFLTLALGVLCSCAKSEPGLVKVDGGLIQGVVNEEMAIYKGIPFAAPPVGDLRWKAPQPVIPWDGVRDASEFSKGPIQGARNMDAFSEDCLYLNIWSPAKSPKDKMPVMVWIYGGGFSGGNAAQFDGAPLARKGVILVTINYRVGWLGYLAHPELSKENPEGVSGNYGILDQIAALKWVQNNIAKFGGDPGNVTIFGESAGGISVSMLCASPLAKGLFRSAISQSGGSFGPYRPTSYPGENMKLLSVAEKDGEAFAAAMGASSIEELRAIDAAKFVGGPVTGGAWPCVDGYVIPDDQYKMYESGNFNDVNILVGYNSDEGASFSRERDPKAHRASIEERFGPYTDKLLEAYPVTETTVPKSGRDLMRDAAFGWHTWIWCRLQKEKGKANVFLYYFDQHPDYPEDSPRYGQASPHGQDVAFVFQNPDESMATNKALSDIIGDYWTNFAKYGDPNGEGLPVWPEFTLENSKAMYLTGDKPFAGPVPDEKSLWVMDSYFAWRRSPEGAAWAK